MAADSIASRIRLARKRAGLTVAEFARRVGVSKSAAHQWETGETKGLRPENLLRVADTLSIDVRWLVKGGAPQPLPATGHAEGESDLLSIPLYNLQAAAGAGAFVEAEHVRDQLVVHPDWLRHLVGYLPAPERLAIIQVRGDSMEPTLHPGDLLLVDRKPVERQEMTDGIYIVGLGNSLLVKRVQVVPSGVVLISDNARYEPVTVTSPDIVAPVIWAWHGQRF